MISESQNLKYEEEKNDKENIDNTKESENKTKQTEALLKTDFFQSADEAEKFLESLDEALEDSSRTTILKEEFVSEFSDICDEATTLVSEIDGLSPDNLLNKKEVFLESIKGVIDNFEDFKREMAGQKINEPFLVAFPKKLGRMVTKNKAAFAAFALFSLATRIHSVEAIEGTPDAVSADNIEHYVNTLNNNTEIYSSDLPNLPEADINEMENARAFEAVIDEDIANGAYYSKDVVSNHTEVEHSTNFSEEDVNKLVSEIKENGGMALSVKSVADSQFYETLVESEGEGETYSSVSSFSDKVAVTVLADVDLSNYKAVGGEIVAEGATPESALLNAIQQVSQFVETEISSGTSSHEKTFSQIDKDLQKINKHATSSGHFSTGNRTDNNFIIHDINIEKNDDGGYLAYQVKIKI